MITIALIFAALTPFVLGALFAVGLALCADCGDRVRVARAACEGRSYVRSGR